MTDLADTYGTWGVVAGGSDGIGASFAHQMAARGMNVVIVARRVALLDEIADDIRDRHGVEVRTLSLDLSTSDAVAELDRATSDVEVGVFVYNVGGDDSSAAFLDKDVETHLALVRRNCDSVIEAAYRFGSPMVERGRGGMVLVTSGAAWAGGGDSGRLWRHQGLRPHSGRRPVGGVAHQRGPRPRPRAQRHRYPVPAQGARWSWRFLR